MTEVLPLLGGFCEDYGTPNAWSKWSRSFKIKADRNKPKSEWKQLETCEITAKKERTGEARLTCGNITQDDENSDSRSLSSVPCSSKHPQEMYFPKTEGKDERATKDGIVCSFENNEFDVLETERIFKAMIFDMAEEKEMFESFASSSGDSSGETSHTHARTRRRRLSRKARQDNKRGVPGNYSNSKSRARGLQAVTVKEFDISESDSEISQDETYRDSVTKDYLLDYEQRKVKENLMNENEKLETTVEALKEKLSNQKEQTRLMEKSMKESKSDNRQLQRQNSKLETTVTVQDDQIEKIKREAASFKNTSETILRKKDNEIKEKTSELDDLKSQIRLKDEEIMMVKKDDERYKGVAKDHEDLMAKIAHEARGLTEKLSNALGRSQDSRENDGVLGVLQNASKDLQKFFRDVVSMRETVKKLEGNVERHNKALSNLKDEKKSLQHDLSKLNDEKKALLKDKAKLQREIKAVRKEFSVKENMCQSFQTRIEELKENISRVRCEKENAEEERKSVGSQMQTLKAEHDKLRQKLGKNKDFGAKIQKQVQALLVEVEEERNYLDRRLEIVQRRNLMKCPRRSETELRQLFGRNTSWLAEKHEEMRTRSQCMDRIMAKVRNDGETLKRMVKSVTQKSQYVVENNKMFVKQLSRMREEYCVLHKTLQKKCKLVARFVEKKKKLEALNASLKTKVAQLSDSQRKDLTTRGILRTSS